MNRGMTFLCPVPGRGESGYRFPLFNGMKSEAQVKEIQSQLRALSSSQRKTYEDVRLDVNTNYLNVVNGNQKIIAARKLVESAKESLRLATGRYENGLGSLLDLTDAQVLLYRGTGVFGAGDL